mmetsp:Transcript_41115/g.89627  ORF Transcript_41115/g.89627 Transcript_41115/m.89627 type:complete len:112 (+) Transcript_41115:2-337(+)
MLARILGPVRRRAMSTFAETVEHDAAAQKFRLLRDSKPVAHVDYAMTADGKVLDLQHTWADPALRGQGLAAAVVSAVFTHCKEKDLKVRPTCSYVGTFVDKNAEWRDFLER